MSIRSRSLFENRFYEIFSGTPREESCMRWENCVYDNGRRTGRTTRMLGAVLETLLLGKDTRYILVACGTSRNRNHIRRRLMDILYRNNIECNPLKDSKVKSCGKVVKFSSLVKPMENLLSVPRDSFKVYTDHYYWWMAPERDIDETCFFMRTSGYSWGNGFYSNFSK